MDTDLPKAQFGYVGRLHAAVTAHGFNAGSLNRDQADTVVRILARTNWKIENKDIFDMWNKGGDVWGQAIKDVKTYNKSVAKHLSAKAKAAKKAEKAAQR